MKFALFYEIPVARPWTPGKEHHAYKNTLEQAILGDEVGLPLLLDRRAPLPRGVLALLEPRGALRRDRGAHREHPHRLRRAPAAEAVQPPDPHARSRWRCSTSSPTAASSSAPAARRRAPSSRASTSTRTRRARCGRRRSSTSSARGPNEYYQADGKYWRMGAPRRVQPKPLQKPHPPILGATSSRRRPQGDRHATGIGLCSFTVGVPPEELVERIDLYREGLAECAKPVGKFVNDSAATFTMVHCAPTPTRRRSPTPKSRSPGT